MKLSTVNMSKKTQTHAKISKLILYNLNLPVIWETDWETKHEDRLSELRHTDTRGERRMEKALL